MDLINKLDSTINYVIEKKTKFIDYSKIDLKGHVDRY